MSHETTVGQSMTHHEQSRGSRLFPWIGITLAVLSGTMLALNVTAVPVVLNVPVVGFGLACLAVFALTSAWFRMRASRSPGSALKMSTAICLAAAIIVVAITGHLAFFSFVEEEIEFQSGDARLSGTIYLPRSDGPYPAVVIVHGSGPEARREYAYYAQRFARAGIAAIAYDKRGVGASSGKLYLSDYHDYGRDAAAAIRALRSRPDVHADAVGLLGFSEAEWTAPLAAIEAGNLAFVAIVGASGMTPAQQVNAEIAIRMRGNGHSEETIGQALALNNRVFEYQRTGQGGEELAAELAEAREHPWFHSAGDIPSEIYPAEEYAWWRSVMDFDPATVWERVSAPVLVLKGGLDAHSPPDVAEREIDSALRRGGNPQLTFLLIPEGDHMLLSWPLGQGVPPPVFAADYLSTLITWMKEKFDTAVRQSEGPVTATQRG